MTSISKSHLSLGGVEVDGEVAVVVVMVGLAAAVAMVVKEEKEVTINAMEDQESQPLLISGDNDGFHESNKLIQLPVLHFFSVLDYGHPFVNFQSFNECWFQSITEYMWHFNADETISSSFI